jgi:hypothetical protein
MNNWLLTLLTVLLLPSTVSAGQPQSPEKIIDRHIKAAGGARALRAITSANFTGTVINPATGEGGLFNWQMKAPSRTYTELIWSGHRWSEAFNGKSAWRLDTTGGLRTLIGQEGARMKAGASHCNDRSLAYKKEKIRVQSRGQAPVGNRPAYVIEFTTRTGIKRKVFFDAENYLILKEEQDAEGSPEEIVFADHRPVDGVMEPFRIEMRRNRETFEIAIGQVVHNAHIEDAVFDYPKTSAAPVPDIATLLRELKNNQARIDRIRENYAFTATVTNVEIDKTGQVAEKSENTYEVFYLGGRPIRKLIKKGDKVLSEKEQQEEEKRVEKVIREHKERQKNEAERRARLERERQKAIAEGKTPKREEDDEAGISTFLRVCQFTNPRRERFRGSEVIVFDFEPKPAYKAQNRSESLTQKLVGVIWIDENAKQVVRLEARLSDAFKIAGGLLASLQRGSAIIAEQEMVNNEVWLPSYSAVNLSAKLFLFAAMNVNRIRRYSDYKKFTVESSSEIGSPPPK